MVRLRLFILLWLMLTACSAGRASTQRPGAALKYNQRLSSEELFARGVALAKHGQLIRAEQYLHLAAESGYPEERTLPILLSICLSSSRLRTALRYAEPYLIRHPESWRLRFLVATIYLALEQTLRAVEQLTRVAYDNPSHAPTYYLLAVINRDAFENSILVGRYFATYLDLAPDGEHASEARAWLREQRADLGRTNRGKLR
ncbi:MAG: hypothetical protein JXA30_20980 [Deltaproteobacteria bacterium]|nr:hypothetical protein [Deltaproteobacteria bacterium]